MRNWKQLAQALGLDIPAGDLARIEPPLEALEQAFRQLAPAIPHHVEPAITFRCGNGEDQ